MTERGGVDVDTSALDAALAQLSRDAEQVARDASLDTARATVQRAARTVPRRSGRLAASLRAVPIAGTGNGTFGAAASMGTNYGGWIEYGGTRGRPYVASGRYLRAGARSAPSLASAVELGLERATARL